MVYSKTFRNVWFSRFVDDFVISVVGVMFWLSFFSNDLGCVNVRDVRIWRITSANEKFSQSLTIACKIDLC